MYWGPSSGSNCPVASTRFTARSTAGVVVTEDDVRLEGERELDPLSSRQRSLLRAADR